MQALGDLNRVKYAKQSRSHSRTDIATLKQHCKIARHMLLPIALTDNPQDLWWVLAEKNNQVLGGSNGIARKRT